MISRAESGDGSRHARDVPRLLSRHALRQQRASAGGGKGTDKTTTCMCSSI
jgi:hypothetical protein